MRGVLMVGFVVWCCNARAQPMHGMAPAFVPMTPAIAADRDAMRKMMGQMNAPYSGEPDHDFVTHMMPHHQGAIDMAQIELKYGHDPKIRQMATDIVAAQEREIAMMQAWLAAHPVTEPHPANSHIQWK